MLHCVFFGHTVNRPLSLLRCSSSAPAGFSLTREQGHLLEEKQNCTHRWGEASFFALKHWVLYWIEVQSDMLNLNSSKSIGPLHNRDLTQYDWIIPCLLIESLFNTPSHEKGQISQILTFFDQVYIKQHGVLSIGRLVCLLNSKTRFGYFVFLKLCWLLTSGVKSNGKNTLISRSFHFLLQRHQDLDSTSARTDGVDLSPPCFLIVLDVKSRTNYADW